MTNPSTPAARTGVSVVIPVHNGALWLEAVIRAIAREAANRACEILVIDDRSTDRSQAIARALAGPYPVRVIVGAGRGAAAALNTGLTEARFPFIAQVDQDVIVQAGWLDRLEESLADPDVAAAQGHYVAGAHAPLLARLAAFDLADRYHAIGARAVDHVCTGNTLYRASALATIGGFDEAFGYGYDNDLSYRLRDAGFRLVFRPDAHSVHHWRSSLAGYCRQQYGQGYGRLQLVAKHPRRVGGDVVSGALMMLHPTVLMLAVILAAAALAGAAVPAMTRTPLTAPWSPWLATTSAALVALLAAERTAAGVRMTWRTASPAPMLWPALHLLRDAVWLGAIATWGARQITGVRPKPSHSMSGRPVATRRPEAAAQNIGREISTFEAAAPDDLADITPLDECRDVLVLIPAHNESEALPEVIADVRRHCPGARILVIDDGSSDNTADVAERLGCNWIQLPVRMGVGGAMRAGLRYARRRHAGVVVRLDGDGQHRAADVARLVAPVLDGRTDVVLGSRYVPTGEGRSGIVRVVQRMLGFCLSRLTGEDVTDPTSGFYALGPAAVRLLCEHHPTGYPEPELRLLLSRCRLRVQEMPMRARARQGGRTSLTPSRIAGAGARVLLAMLIVPLRHAGDVREHD